jgi:hypothetical protein
MFWPTLQGLRISRSGAELQWYYSTLKMLDSGKACLLCISYAHSALILPQQPFATALLPRLQLALNAGSSYDVSRSLSHTAKF